MKNTKKLCAIAILTAMYVVLSAFLKIPFIGNIMLDLGYLAFVVALCEFGVWGAFVGAVGCALESLLFSAYGFSISWFVANLIIGIGCGFIFCRCQRFWVRAIAVVVFGAVGLLGAKTAIACYLYSIPLLVKLPKNATAFAVDAVVMLLGLGLHQYLRPKIKK